jgi:hypothetical protein
MSSRAGVTRRRHLQASHAGVERRDSVRHRGWRRRREEEGDKEEDGGEEGEEEEEADEEDDAAEEEKCRH